jgi:hypothetical protein
MASIDFEDLFENTRQILEPPASQVLYVFCNHGVHRSPAVASIVHCVLTPHATVVYNRPRTRRAFEALRLRQSPHDSWLAGASCLRSQYRIGMREHETDLDELF